MGDAWHHIPSLIWMDSDAEMFLRLSWFIRAQCCKSYIVVGSEQDSSEATRATQMFRNTSGEGKVG